MNEVLKGGAYVVEAANYHATANYKVQWLISVATAVEFGAVVQIALVMHVDRVAVGSNPGRHCRVHRGAAGDAGDSGALGTPGGAREAGS